MMTGISEIAPGVYSLGARHPQLEVFDELFPTVHGTTYNAYLIRGTEKTALIDTVKEPFTAEYLDRVRSLVPLEEIDLVVVNHTEPDHSGALASLLALNPAITVVCSKAAANFLGQLIEAPFKTHTVAEGEEIDLGGKTLRFILAPNLHWPDTIFTYLPQEAILFSCDAFGAHYCGDGLYNDEVGDFRHEFEFYFDAIMRPFKAQIREAIAKIDALKIGLVCPSHGPLLRRDPRAAIERYRELSAPPAAGPARALILTLSPHGNTRRMAQAVRQGLESAALAVTELALYNLDPGTLRDELERSDLLLIGVPTVNRDAPPPVWGALALLSSVTPRGKVAGVFGSYGWSGEAVALVEERLRGLKYQLPVAGIHFRFKPTAEDVQACQAFGAALGKALSCP